MALQKKIMTDTGVDVTDRINDGRTTIVSSKKEAEELTKYFGYFYPLYDEKNVHIGYGVPK